MEYRPARFSKRLKMNRGAQSTTMEDLDDHILTQILLRLPSCRTVLACTPVCKRWCSLISDSSFPNMFVNHKTGSDIDDEPPWNIVKTMMTKRAINETRFVIEFIIESPKLSLEFLPSNIFAVRATFKDLVLCSDSGNQRGGSRVYYITNPLTKQCVVMPPGRRVKDQWLITNTVLVCQDYKFRVVEVRVQLVDHSFDTIELVVYCSEIGEWKEISLALPKTAEVGPETVVCNGIIYFKSGLSLVALNPFDLNGASDTTLEAKAMPPLPGLGFLLESSGQLLVVRSPDTRAGRPCLLYKKDGTSIELPLLLWKLDPNQVPLVWKTTFKGLCKGPGNQTDSAFHPGLYGATIYGNDIVVHPYNDKLIYMSLVLEDQLVLCNTETGCITPLKSLSNYRVMRSTPFSRLDHQWWPTFVPTFTIPHRSHSRAELATTTTVS